MEAASGRERQAREYLEKHGIMELLNHLTTVLLFFRPALKTLGLCTEDEVLKGEGHIVTLDQFRDEVNKRTEKIWSSF
ncbi:EF-hand calcium-binding domain-containing protein 10 isoform X3 [Ochotona curzoniae]|uniref:EF-hand calcium-binding domain-containing protein 10 isoform X3 n=1 Tax=Ochotona curzoniae TaxID=130825 RepID=UPI001B3465CF|nr:EF-hand calcium-binding domain-containing protein 10 isoform X3 [Ochotona curzoniae]